MKESVDGISETTYPFQPGDQVTGGTIKRTFQPSYVVTGSGILVAFCQGRLKEGRDDDPKLVLMNRSRDWGQTWEKPRVVSAPMNHFAISAYRPTPAQNDEKISFLTVVDLRVTEEFYGKDYEKMHRETGIDIDEVGRDTPTVLCRFDSEDCGETWAMETLTGDQTPLNKRYGGAMLVMLNPIGQVHVIPEGPYKGRMIIGCHLVAVPEDEEVTNHFRNHPPSGSGIIYSHDHGRTWHMDGMIMDYLGNEASAVSIKNGSEILLIRRLNKPDHFKNCPPLTDFRPGLMQRTAHTSPDCGKTWSAPFAVNISDVICHGTLRRAGERLLFSTPAGSDLPPEQKNLRTERVRGTVYFSNDDGNSWKHKLIDEESFSYSTIGPLTEDHHIVFFGRGAMGDKGIGCRVFTDAWLES